MRPHGGCHGLRSLIPAAIQAGDILSSYQKAEETTRLNWAMEEDAYSLFLDGKTAYWLRDAGNYLGLRVSAGMKKGDLVHLLSGSTDRWIEILKKKMSARQNIGCSILVANNGSMDESRLWTLVSIRMRQLGMKYVADTSWDLRVSRTFDPLELVMESDVSRNGRGNYTLTVSMPVPLRGHFEPLVVDLSPASAVVEGVEFLPGNSFEDLVGRMIQAVQSTHPRLTSGRTRLPVSLTSEVLRHGMESSKMFKSLDLKYYMSERSFNAILSDFLLDVGMLRVSHGHATLGNSVISSGIPDSSRLSEMFIDWFSHTSGAEYTGLNSSAYIFEGKKSELYRSASAVKPHFASVMKRLPSGSALPLQYIIDMTKYLLGGSLHLDVYGGLYSPDGIVSDVVAEIIRAFILVPLAALGIVQVDDGCQDIMMTPPSASKSITENIRITPNFEVLVSPGASPSAVMRLIPLSNTVSADSGTTLLRISRSKMLQSIRSGAITADQITDILKNAGFGFPENVRKEVLSWLERYGEVTLRDACLIECRDRSIAEGIMSYPKARKLVKQRLNDTTMEISYRDMRRFLSRLDSVGIYSAVEEGAMETG